MKKNLANFLIFFILFNFSLLAQNISAVKEKLNLSFKEEKEVIQIPELTGRIVDLTNTLSFREVEKLEKKLKDLEDRKGSQIAVLIIPTTGLETIEEYSIKVAEKWKIGRKGIDDGVILIISKHDRRLRIEVGYGLEGVIPDAVAKRIIEEIIVPNFKKGNFYEGIDKGVDAIIKLLEGESLPKPKKEGEKLSQDTNQFLLDKKYDYYDKKEEILLMGTFLLSLILYFFTSSILYSVGIPFFIFGTITFFLYDFNLDNLIVIFVFSNMGWIILKKNNNRYSRYRWYGSKGGFSGGSSFSGGGGSFGGGGASGSW